MIRLTGGEFRGRAIQTPKSDRTRPTQSKLRQALFNSLQARIAGARILDLFSGSGALGFEALSRGAEDVVFIESTRAAIRLIEKNAQELGVASRVLVLDEAVPRSGFTFWKRVVEKGPYDIILADPPYADGWEGVLLTHAPWGELLREHGVFCIEWGAAKSAQASLPDSAPFLVKIREKHYGDSVLSTFERGERIL